MPFKLFFVFTFGLILFPAIWWGSEVANAQSQVEQLQAEIKQRNDRLDSIQAEIAKYELELTKVGAEKQTLQSGI